ncbi:MAG: hypothetical protein CMH11_20080 [Maritimibacter sp.]|nr:hypothetical protein [Maritimibacter sp.]
MLLIGFGMLAAIVGLDFASDPEEEQTEDGGQTDASSGSPPDEEQDETGDVDAPDPDDTPDATDTAGVMLTLNEEEVLYGSAGEDMLVPDAETDPESATEEVFLEEGDDVATVDSMRSVDVFGGEGDDTISLDKHSSFSSAHGEDGDDTINLAAGNFGYGGEGNDVINLDVRDGTPDYGGAADGGAGDDTIVAQSGFIESRYFYGGVNVEGGEGKDTFDLSYHYSGFADPEFIDEPDAEAATHLGVKDFTPGEDTLSITIVNETDDSLDLKSAQIVDGSTLQITFNAGSEHPEFTTSIRLGSSGIELDDVTLVVA